MESVQASLRLPVSEQTAFGVVSDLNTIVRLSPFFTLRRFESLLKDGPGKGSAYTLTIEYYHREVTETLRVDIDEFEKDRKIVYRVGSDVLREILFTVEPDEAGIQLTQMFQLESEDENIVNGSRNELHYWLRSIGEYVKLAEGGSFRRRLMKSFMDKIWLKLSLSERKIALITVKISILELVFLLVMVVIWNIAVR